MYLLAEETVDFWNIPVYWGFILALVAIFIALMVAHLLIGAIKPLKKALIPSSVLGGFLLFAVLSIYKAITGKPLLDSLTLEMLTYHCLGIGFVATALKVKSKKEKEEKKKNSLAIFNSSLITVSGYLIQAIVGLIVSIGLFFLVKAWPGSGMLVPMGYGQGPGQALNWGKIYEALTEATSEFGSFVNGKSFGLAIAALGFISASVGGIIYLNAQRRKGNKKFTVIADDDYKEKVTVETFQGKNELPSTGTIDKSSVQIGLVLVSYAISFLIIYGISIACDASGVKFLINTVKPLFWGFNFIIGTAVAALVRGIVTKLTEKKVLKRQQINNYMMDRISGVAFDIMVVAAIASINLEAFKNKSFIIPLIVMGIAAAVVTYIYTKIVCKHLFSKDGYYEESFLCMYGMLTGTASTGIILLREIDPEFKTPACNNMIFQALWSIALGAPVLLLMNTAVVGWKNLLIVLGVFIVYFAVVVVLIYRDAIFKSKKKVKKVNSSK